MVRICQVNNEHGRNLMLVQLSMLPSKEEAGVLVSGRTHLCLRLCPTFDPEMSLVELRVELDFGLISYSKNEKIR